MAIQPKDRIANLNLKGLDHSQRPKQATKSRSTKESVEELSAPATSESEAEALVPPPPPRPRPTTTSSPVPAEAPLPADIAQVAPPEIEASRPIPPSPKPDVEAEVEPPPISLSPRPTPAATNKPELVRCAMRVYVDQRKNLREMSRILDLHTTTIFAEAVERHAEQVIAEGLILQPVRRPSGPQPNETVIPLQIKVPAHVHQRLKEVADAVSEGVISVAARRIIDLEAERLDIEHQERPTIGINAGAELPLENPE